jgi:type I restriction-modification system DNA methylase subunit
MAAPKELVRLVENFERNLTAYTSAAYNEAQLRVEFLDPMFELMGWDVHNKAGNAEAYKDVVHEDALRFSGTTKAPDYSFRIGGTRKFFLEAKKPSVSIKDEPTPAYQLRRYAWSAKLPLSILSDFAELAVYDCRVKPEKTDKPAIARINYLTFDAYPDKWDEIAGIFSKDAVLKGSFDRFAVTAKGKRGTAAVDAEFLKEIERWRELLARNIALRNPRLSIRELNEAVQRTIDRIVFLRICEDRGIETDRQFQLQFLLNGANTYSRLFELFQRADERYNSGLFHFQREKGFTEAPDTLTPGLKIDDKPLQDIIANLYYPDSPYEFSVLSADILGQVYEQFLGKVIRLTAGHRAVVEDKPEVKKAGGVYYTPTYIVDYIVEHTVGELLKETTPKQATDLKILDPACGSGSFLLGAYQRLLDWHRDWYVNDGSDKHTRLRKGGQPALFQAGHGEWRLTTAERKRILLNSIFGVDIDPQAVEVTKLSLLLKVLEGESDQTLQTQLKLFHERALPDLASNIKCGNSLIGSDFFQGRQGELFDDEEALRVNAFDWDKGFPEIFARANPGFDAVIGNPPYGADYSEADKVYFKKGYSYRRGKPETYIFFLERGLRLLRRQGLLGYITPNAWLTNYYGVQLRELLLKSARLIEIADLEPSRVFAGAVVDTSITVLRAGSPPPKWATAVSRAAGDRTIEYQFRVPQGAWLADPERVINLQANPDDARLLLHLESSGEALGTVVEYSQGIIPYKTKADGVKNAYISVVRTNRDWVPLYESASQIRRYEIAKPKAFVLYGPWLWCPRDPRFFKRPKILFHRLRKKLPRQLVGALDITGAANRHSLSNLILRDGFPPDTLKAVLALFNSQLANWWFAKRYGLLMEVAGFKVARIPLPVSWSTGWTDLAAGADRMLALHAKLAAARTDHEKTVLQRQIDATDREIDQLVYELYGLTDDEIKIVEELSRQ